MWKIIQYISSAYIIMSLIVKYLNLSKDLYCGYIHIQENKFPNRDS